MATPPDGLDGSLRLYLGRFLHLVVELELDAPIARDEINASPRYGDDRSVNEYGDFGAVPPPRYRIFEDRILKSGELRYFDHPKFGVLAKASRVEEIPDETPEMPETLQDLRETELLGYPPE